MRGVILRNIQVKNDVLKISDIDNWFNVYEYKDLPCYTIHLLSPVSISVLSKRKFLSPIVSYYTLSRKICKNVSSTNSSWFPNRKRWRTLELRPFACMAWDIYHAMCKSQEK